MFDPSSFAFWDNPIDAQYDLVDVDTTAEQGARPVQIILPGERPPSWNDSYAGQHWTKRRVAVERVRMAVRAAIDPEQCEPFTVPVCITVTVFFASKSQDADNIPAKLYVDALKGWIIADDDGRYVRSVTTVTEMDAKAPRVVIDVRPAAG